MTYAFDWEVWLLGNGFEKNGDDYEFKNSYLLCQIINSPYNIHLKIHFEVTEKGQRYQRDFWLDRFDLNLVRVRTAFKQVSSQFDVDWPFSDNPVIVQKDILAKLGPSNPFSGLFKGGTGGVGSIPIHDYPAGGGNGGAGSANYSPIIHNCLGGGGSGNASSINTKPTEKEEPESVKRMKEFLEEGYGLAYLEDMTAEEIEEALEKLKGN